MVSKNNSGLFDISRTLCHVAERVEKQGPLNAELDPACSPHWCVAVTVPGQDGIAAGHLIGRRFGVYQPLYPDDVMIRGRMQKRWRKLFPGYLFLFVWNIEKHAGRIRACAGVRGLLCVDDHPVIIADHEIDRIRAEENKLIPVQWTVDVVKVRRRRKKRTVIHEQQIVEAEADEIVGVSSKSYWSGLDEPTRFTEFHKALGLTGKLEVI